MTAHNPPLQMSASRHNATLLAAALALSLIAPAAFAQPVPGAKSATDAPAAKSAAAPETHRAPALACDTSTFTEKTIYLANSVQQTDDNELISALRNLLDACDRTFLVLGQSAIVVQAPADQIAHAEKLIKELDRPKKTYRLTYTVTEMDEGKRVSMQHYAMVVAAGQATTLKEGSKVPIATGSYAPNSPNSSSAVQTQFTYIDTGMTFEATLDEFSSGVRLRSSVEQSSVAEQTSGVGPQDPIIRSASLKGTAFLAPGKPLVLGSLDIPGSTRHLDIEVTMEQLP